ncbi:uncharacterized protein LOC142560668 isoform X2 [Dermacentor variabilis]|uniref:uncharacterized protein LOC142560668 isoform X2 n=1 Tax=Dermacentor variabilis TaxID=34621 RepID=UPI003F5C4556
MLQKLNHANMREWSRCTSNGFRIERLKGSRRREFDLVILEGSFRGFVIQARKSNERGSLVLGEFKPGSDDSTRTHTCSGHENAVISGADGSTKATATWQAPSDWTGAVVFRALVMRNHEATPHYVVSDSVVLGKKAPRMPQSAERLRDVESQQDDEQPRTTDSPIISVDENDRETKVVEALAVDDEKHEGNKEAQGGMDEIQKACGETKGCFGFPDGCIAKGSCQMLVSYVAEEEGYHFELTGPADAERMWIAAGISESAKMELTSVVECIRSGEKILIRESWNQEGTANTLLETPTAGITFGSHAMTDGVLKCTWKRKAMTTVQGKTFDLAKNKYFVLLAKGDITDTDAPPMPDGDCCNQCADKRQRHILHIRRMELSNHGKLSLPPRRTKPVHLQLVALGKRQHGAPIRSDYHRLRHGLEESEPGWFEVVPPRSGAACHVLRRRPIGAADPQVDDVVGGRVNPISGMSLRHLFFLVMLSRGAVCYPNGAPAEACGDMTPNHGPNAKASSDKGDLKLTAAPHDKRSAKVTLEGTFKGFLIKAVDSDGTVVGSFTPDMPDIAKGIECDGHSNSAITHTSRGEKSSVPVTWTASDKYKGGDVIFRATVVRSKDDYYLKLESSALKIEGPSPSDPNKNDEKEKPGSSPTSRSEVTAWLVVPVLGCVILNVRHRCLAYL